MLIIKDIITTMENRLDAAADAIKQALIYKDDNPDTAQRFYQDSIELLNMYQRHHDQIVLIINNYKKEKGEPPAPMLAVYNYLHEKAIDKMTNIHTLQETFKK